jgi:hypothetical protein
MTTLVIHLVAFWNVAVMNCIQPVNWEACAPVHEWLVPDLIEGYKLYTGDTHPYQTEKDYLKNNISSPL